MKEWPGVQRTLQTGNRTSDASRYRNVPGVILLAEIRGRGVCEAQRGEGNGWHAAWLVDADWI